MSPLLPFFLAFSREKARTRLRRPAADLYFPVWPPQSGTDGSLPFIYASNTPADTEIKTKQAMICPWVPSC